MRIRSPKSKIRFYAVINAIVVSIFIAVPLLIGPSLFAKLTRANSEIAFESETRLNRMSTEFSAEA